ncbi:hypothetical protein NPIL_159811 [Nephila pilipes]|uniref:Uncharacterized protein n=1 Tax=Nephila pilipes TaxID=299642 RepID=A0A8X6Q051_NEPPI|nr:hypothetical protein NPIL_159811 [Nephila pilipes]
MNSGFVLPSQGQGKVNRGEGCTESQTGASPTQVIVPKASLIYKGASKTLGHTIRPSSSRNNEEICVYPAITQCPCLGVRTRRSKYRWSNEKTTSNQQVLSIWLV